MVLAKYVVYSNGLEFIQPNFLVGSVVTGALFVMGFILAGLVTDYKEAERAPAEIRALLEKIWDEARALQAIHGKLNIEGIRSNILAIINSFIRGVEKQSGFADLRPCIENIRKLSNLVSEIEMYGTSSTSISRIKDARENLLKIVLRIYYIQRIAYLPSARLLADVLMIGVITVLFFTESQNITSAMATFGILAYFVNYMNRLTHILDTPFRKGEKTQDDISLFLLKEFHEELANTGIKILPSKSG